MAADVLGDDLPGPPTTTPVAAAFINLLYCTSSSHSLDADRGVVGTALTRRTADGWPCDRRISR
jgi:hypothetical protein